MRRLLLGLFLIFFFLFTFYCFGFSKGRYEEGDWVSYTVFRYITSISMDYNYVYFGTTGGVTRYERFKERWDDPFTTSDGLPDNWIRDIFWEQETNELWVKSFSGEVSQYEPTIRRWYNGGEFPQSNPYSQEKIKFPNFLMDFGYTFFTQGYISDMNLNRYDVMDYLNDGFDNLWIGTWGLNAGMGSLRDWGLKMFKFGLYDNDVKAICLDGDDIWFGGWGLFRQSGGITRYDRKTGVWDYFESFSIRELRSTEVNTIEADSRFVWFGTNDGLVRYEKKTGKWDSYGRRAGLSDEEITALKSTGKILWVGTKWGLNFYWVENDSIGKVSHPLLDEVWVNAIEENEDYLWVGTNSGLLRMEKTEGEWERFTSPDGILNGRVNSVVKDKDEIWFATDRGISVYDVLAGKTTNYLDKLNFPGGEAVKLAVNEKTVWAATYHGVWKLDKRTQSWRLFTKEDGLLDNDVQTVVLDGDYVWLGTSRGVSKFYWNNPARIDY